MLLVGNCYSSVYAASRVIKGNINTHSDLLAVHLLDRGLGLLRAALLADEEVADAEDGDAHDHDAGDDDARDRASREAAPVLLLTLLAVVGVSYLLFFKFHEGKSFIGARLFELLALFLAVYAALGFGLSISSHTIIFTFQPSYRGHAQCQFPRHAFVIIVAFNMKYLLQVFY